jgi:hypothetical protein
MVRGACCGAVARPHGRGRVLAACMPADAASGARRAVVVVLLAARMGLCI